MNELKIKTADEQWGYPFGVDGVMDTDEARRYLGNVSLMTLKRLVDDGRLRQGRLPGGKKLLFCRRTVQEFTQMLEA